MTNARRPISVASAWAWICSGVGYHLDNFGRWLIVRAPRLGTAYAGWWTPGVQKLIPQPGWGFANIYYVERQWTVCRRGALWEAARDNHLVVPLSVPWLAGTTVDVTLGNDNSLCLYVCGSYEPNEFNFLHRVLKPGMVFVDVGANDGLYTVFAASRLGPEGRVVAIEPSSRERKHLQSNLGRNGLTNVSIVAKAVGESAGTVDLIVAHGEHAGHNTLGGFAHDDVVPAGRERVSLDTLDAIAASEKLPRVDFIKIDVEGAETKVLVGARTLIAKMRPLLMMEIDDGALRAQGSDQKALLDLLQVDLEYDIFIVSGETGLITRPGPGEALSTNIVAMPREKMGGKVFAIDG